MITPAEVPVRWGKPMLRGIRWRARETGREARVYRVASRADIDVVWFRFVDEPVRTDNLRRATARQFLEEMERV